MSSILSHAQYGAVFWTEHVLKLFGPDAVQRVYPTLNSDATVYYDVVKLCLQLLEGRGSSIAAQLSETQRSNSHRLMMQRSSRQMSRQPSDTLLRPRGNTEEFIAQNASMVLESVPPAWCVCGSAIKISKGSHYCLGRVASQVKQSSEVLDTFENDRKTWQFFASVFPFLLKRAAENLRSFEGFELNHLSELAKSGRETLDKVIPDA